MGETVVTEHVRQRVVVTGDASGIGPATAKRFLGDGARAVGAGHRGQPHRLMKTIALEHAPWLRSNAVCPGYVLTPMQQSECTPEMLETVNRQIPMGRHARPDEIAALFAFLASDEAAYITGQCISIDGGETA